MKYIHAIYKDKDYYYARRLGMMLHGQTLCCHPLHCIHA